MSAYGRRAALAAAILAGCAEEHFDVGLDVSDGSLVVLAVVTDQETPRISLLPPGSSLVRTTAAQGDRIYAFAVEPHSFVDPNGQLLAPEIFSGLLGRARGEPSEAPGSCGRCPAPALRAPQLILSGSSCAPPAWAESRAYAVGAAGVEALSPPQQELDAIREGIVLDWPGDCSCAGVEDRSDGRLAFCPLTPQPIEMFEEIVNDRFGNLVAQRGRALLIAPRGEPVAIMDRSSIGASAVGIVGTSSASDRLTVLVASSGMGSLLELESISYDPLAPAGSRLTHSPLSLDTDMGVSGLESSGNGEHLLFGEVLRQGRGTEPAIAKCGDPSGPVLECTKPPLEVCPFDLGAMVTVKLLADGRGAALGPAPSLYLKPSGSDTWGCAEPLLFPNTLFEGSLYEWAGAFGQARSRLAVLGETLFACVDAQSRSESFGVAVLAIPVPDVRTGPQGEVVTSPVSSRMIWFEEGGTRCENSWLEEHGHLLISFGNGRSIEVDESGSVLRGRAVVDDADPELEGLPASTNHLLAAGDQWQFASVMGSSLYRRQRGGSFELVHGRIDEDEDPVEAIDSRSDDRFVWFSRKGQRILEGARRGAACEDLSLGELVPIAGWPDGVAPYLATKDLGRPDRHVVVCDDGVLRWVELDRVVDELLLPFQGERIIDLQALTSDSFVLIGPEGELYGLRGHELSKLAVDYDDPATAAEEGPRLSLSERPAFSVLDGAHGVLWAGGDYRLARILPGFPGELPIVEGFWLGHAQGTEIAETEFNTAFGGEPHITAMRADCADRAVLAWSEIANSFGGGDNQRARVVDLGPVGDAACEGPSGDLRLCTRAQSVITLRSHPVEAARALPIAVLPAEGKVVLDRAGSGLFSPVTGVGQADDVVVEGGPLGRLGALISQTAK